VDVSGCTVKDVPARAFIEKYAQHLKRQGKMEIPSWMDVVKTAPFKELPPMNPDWYYVRAASVARKIYLRPHTGVGALTKWYGGRYRRGTRTEHYRKASSGLIRHILLQLEHVGVVEKQGKGRIVSRVGQQDLDRIAGQLREEQAELAAKLASGESGKGDAEGDDEDEDEDEEDEESEEEESEDEDSDDDE